MERVRLVDWLKSERDQHVGGGLYYNSQILFAYNSNHMEGSTLSPEQTAQLFNTDALLPDNINDEIRADDVAETTNHFNAFNWALDHVDDPVNKGSVKPTLTYERGALIREEVQTFSLWPLLLNGYRYSKARGVHVQHQCSGCES